MIGVKELKGKTAEEIKTMMSSIDTDKNGCIDYTEFLAATMEQNSYLKDNKLFQAFKTLDKDGNGKITADELKEVVESENPKYGKEYYEQIIKEADLNGDGMIDYQEFLEMMNRKQK